MNRAQQAYYLENQRFAVDTAAVAASAAGVTPVVTAADASTGSQKLGIGVKNTVNYTYTSIATDPTLDIINRGASQNKDLKGHIGASFSNLGQTPTILCAAKVPALETTTVMTTPTIVAATGVISCIGNTEPVGQ